LHHKKCQDPIKGSWQVAPSGYASASYPLCVPLETGAFVHGDNGIGNMTLPEPTMPEGPLRAPQAIID